MGSGRRDHQEAALVLGAARCHRSERQAVPADNLPAGLVLPMGRYGPAFLAYPNFDIYLEWNNSLVYTTTA